MKVTVYCAPTASESSTVGLAVRCTPAERRVCVERGTGAGRKIAFSSTYDGVVDGSAAEAAEALYNAAITPAVTAVIEGKESCVLCVGSGSAKRDAILGAAADMALTNLLRAADEKGLELSMAAVHVLWERLTDLLDGNQIEPGTTATGSDSENSQNSATLFGASMRVLASTSAASSALREVVAAADAAETAAIGVPGTGHVVVQITLGEGRLLLVDAADLTFAEETASLLSSTLCHHSHTMLAKCLAKPSSRPAVADTALLPRMLSSAFFEGGSAARLVVHVPPSASQPIVDMLRTAQQASKAAKSKRASDDRGAAVIELLQARLADTKAPPTSADVEDALRAAMGDDADVQAQLDGVSRELKEVEAELDAARGASTAVGEGGEEEAEAERMLAAWASEEETLAAQLAAERDEADQLMATLKAREAARGDGGSDAARELQEQIDKYEAAVDSAWSDVQRAQKQAEETEARFDRAREFARRSAAEKEEMENTLLDVAADLENLARNYRQHGSPAMAVPLYVSALAIFEKTLGPEHPQVASNLVNLGNAFCDQQKHIDAVPVYLRALAIDEKALGHDHPEVAMDLSNLGIAYRALGRADIASGLFERAHKIMLNAVGPDDPKTKAILRNLS